MDDYHRSLAAERAAWAARNKPSDLLFASLAFLRPDLAVEFDDVNEVAVHEVRPSDGTRVWWRCTRDVRHRWIAMVRNRAYLGSGCPYCWKRCTSRREIELYEALRVVLPGLQHHGRRLRIDRSAGDNRHRWWQVDMLLPGDPPVIVEYDGAYWHRDAVAKDRRKTADLRAGGAVVVRIREDPLPPITAHDVVCVTAEAPVDVASRVTAALRAAGVEPAEPGR